MSTRAEAVKKERDTLLMRSALCRLRLHRGAAAVRSSTAWSAASTAAHLAGPVVRLARVAHAVLGFVRHAARFGAAQTRPARKSDARSPSPIGSAP